MTGSWWAGSVTDYSRCNSGGVGLLNRCCGVRITISAAIASNAGTFWNQNYDIGSQLGVLKVIGSIAQNWRGPVATTGGTGFAKNYVYDQRLLTTAPPKFLQPVSTSYGVTTQVEVQSAYKVDGTCAKTTPGCADERPDGPSRRSWPPPDSDMVIGSFLNVVVYRVPAGLSVVAPASACPQCGHAIRRRDNVPVLSWLVLRGRCRDCGAGSRHGTPRWNWGRPALRAGRRRRVTLREHHARGRPPGRRSCWSPSCT